MTFGDPDRTLAPLVALLDIVGPVDAPALLHQLCADLASCDVTIRDALPDQDLLALRRASHNLTALAGTAGASDLQQMAELLNTAAHANDLSTIRSLCPRIRHDLASLTSRIKALSTLRET